MTDDSAGPSPGVPTYLLPPCGCIGPRYQPRGAPPTPSALPSSLLPPNISWCLDLLAQREDSAQGRSPLLPPPPSSTGAAPARNGSALIALSESRVGGLGRRFCLLPRTKKQRLEMLYTSDELPQRGGWRGDPIIRSIIVSELQLFILTLNQGQSHPFPLRLQENGNRTECISSYRAS